MTIIDAVEFDAAVIVYHLVVQYNLCKMTRLHSSLSSYLCVYLYLKFRKMINLPEKMNQPLIQVVFKQTCLAHTG